MLRVLFNSDFFKNARFAHVKSPAELVVSTVRLAGNFQGPRPGFNSLAFECNYQGQELLNPPSVESWHTGGEWIDGGALVRRVNFAAGLLGDITLPGVKAIISDLKQRGATTPQEFVDGCLDLVGPLDFSESTKAELLDQATEDGGLNWESETESERSKQKIGVMLALIAASRDFQFA